MKLKYIIVIVITIIAVLAVRLYVIRNGSQSPPKLDTQAGFHVYYPSYLPPGFNIDDKSKGFLPHQIAQYSASFQADQSRHFIFFEMPLDQTKLTTDLNRWEHPTVKSKTWAVKNMTIGDSPAYLGHPSASVKPQSPILIFIKNGIRIDIIADLGESDQDLISIAQSMK